MKKMFAVVLCVFMSLVTFGCKDDEISSLQSETFESTMNEDSITQNFNATESEDDELSTLKGESVENLTDAPSENINDVDKSSISESQSVNSSSEVSAEGYEPDDYMSIGNTLYQNGIDMYENVFFNSYFKLDYDSVNVNGLILVDDESISSVDDIAEFYCRVFAEPDDYIYERYVESNGRVYCYDASRGTNIYYTKTDLEFVSEDSSELTFNAISHYSNPETGESMDDKTNTFKVKLVDGNYKITEFKYPK